jgi:nucleotide-binding universal stress UspA family protein
MRLPEATMNIERILVPYDFSECSAAALDYASRFADPNARLHIVHVDELLDVRISPYLPANGRYIHESLWDRRHEQVEQQLAKIIPRHTAARYEHHCTTGYPGDELLAFAERTGVDLIVMGSHGRTGLARLVTGSVAEQVMRRSKCPVLIVKAPMIRSKVTPAAESESAALHIEHDFAI